jgi:serine/threonine protein phosphatase PrpC
VFDPTGKSRGDVDPTKFKKLVADWGRLPPREQQAALQELTRGMNPRYREAIENYFRNLTLEELSPDVYKAELQLGDTLLLCTDGLTTHVPDELIRGHLQAQEPAQDTCHKLIKAAKEAGGRDNITAIVARFDREVQSVDDAIEAMADNDVPRTPTEPVNAGDQEPAAILQPVSAEHIAVQDV